MNQDLPEDCDFEFLNTCFMLLDRIRMLLRSIFENSLEIVCKIFCYEGKLMNKPFFHLFQIALRYR